MCGPISLRTVAGLVWCVGVAVGTHDGLDCPDYYYYYYYDYDYANETDYDDYYTSCDTDTAPPSNPPVLSDAVHSSGCAIGPYSDIAKGQLTEETIVWNEDGLPEANRSYSIFVPDTYEPGTPVVLWMIFHGWGETGSDYHCHYAFRELAIKHGFIAVYPQGMDDCDVGNGAECSSGGAGFASWNGAGSAESTAALQACDPHYQIYDYCYTSVRLKKGACHQCDWTTGYDDVGFVSLLLDRLEERFCIDRRHIFAWGCSNGGIFVHELARSLPGRIAAIAAACGGKPHLGWEDRLQPGAAPVSALFMGGREDDTLPRFEPELPDDACWWDGFQIANVTSAAAAYVRHANCTGIPRSYATPFDANNAVCIEEGHACNGGAGVVRCAFDGGHDLNTADGADELDDGPQLAYEFFMAHPLDAANVLPAPSVQATTAEPSSDVASFSAHVAGFDLRVPVATLVAVSLQLAG